MDDWYPVRDGTGRWIVVDAAGRQPLLDPDPVARMYAVHLAAAAPGLRAGAAEMLRRWPDARYLYGHDHRIAAHVDGSVSMSFPSPETLRAAGAFDAVRPPLELPFDGPTEEVAPGKTLLLRDRDLRRRSRRS